MRKLTFNKEDIYRGYLVLVNQLHPIREADFFDTRFKKPAGPVFLNDMKLVSMDLRSVGIRLEMKTASVLSQIFRLIGCGNEIVPVSGYRSREEQELIYKESFSENGEEFTKKFVALPDHSEHQTGLAIDLGLRKDKIDFIRPDFPYEGICDVFRKIAPKYGFIERYIEKKQAVTGISHEPWHFRYVGYPHSQIMQERNLCLEEYVQFIKDYPQDGRHLHIRDMTKDIEVSYVACEAGITGVEVPENINIKVSGNNADGFIITAWR